MDIPSKTIIITLGIGYFITLLFIISYEYKQLSKPIKHTFLFAKLIQIIAWLGLAYGEGDYAIPVLAISNTLLFISYTLEVIALLISKNLLTRIENRLLYTFMALSIIAYNIVIFFFNVMEIRIVIHSIGIICIYFFMYRMIFSRGATYLMKLIGSLYWCTLLISLIRGLLTVFSDVPTSVYAQSIYQWIYLLGLYIFSNLGTIGFVLLMKEEVDRELYHFANFDDLTEVLNRRSFNNKVQNALSDYAKKSQPVTYVLFDIDYFKTINDTYGHLIGDKVLQHLTTTIKEHLQPNDLFSRYGGDEFAMLLVDKTEAEAIEFIKQIKQSIQPLAVDDVLITYAISLGVVTVIPTDETHIEALYNSCDKALYDAKKNGRNIFVTGQLEATNEFKHQ